jgi:hypothetical protein
VLLQIHEENSGNALNECLSVPRCPKPTFLRFVGDLWIFASSTLIAGMKFDRTFCFFPSLYDVWESSSSSVMWWLPEERCVWRVPTGVDQGTHVPEDLSGINPDTMVWNRFFRSQTPSLIWVAAFDKGFLLKSVCGFFLGCSLGANFASGETPLWHVLNVFFCHWVLFFPAVCRSRSKIVRWVCSTAAAAAGGQYSVGDDSSSVPLLCFHVRGAVLCPPTTGSSRRR